MVNEYKEQYKIKPDILSDNEKLHKVKEAAKIELGMIAFLEEGGFNAFTTTFEDLYGLKQLPGLAVQRLMEAGYGFGAEGDWKTASLVRSTRLGADHHGHRPEMKNVQGLHSPHRLHGGRTGKGPAGKGGYRQTMVPPGRWSQNQGNREDIATYSRNWRSLLCPYGVDR